MASTVVALGGGGFSMEDSGLLDDYVLEQTGVDHPKILFLGQASGEADSYLLKYYRGFSGKAEADHLSLFQRDLRPLETRIEWADVIYVGGGNTVNLLAVWRAHGLPDLLRGAYERGGVLAGISAGANCWFEASATDSYGGFSPLCDGLGLLEGSVCPHFRNEPLREAGYREWVQSGQLPAGIALDDGAAACFVNGNLVEVATSRAEAGAFRGAEFSALPVRLLG